MPSSGEMVEEEMKLLLPYSWPKLLVEDETKPDAMQCLLREAKV